MSESSGAPCGRPPSSRPNSNHRGEWLWRSGRFISEDFRIDGANRSTVGGVNRRHGEGGGFYRRRDFNVSTFCRRRAPYFCCAYGVWNVQHDIKSMFFFSQASSVNFSPVRASISWRNSALLSSASSWPMFKGIS